MDLQDWHPRYDMPKTKALMDQKQLSLSAEDQWWMGLLVAGELPGPKDDRDPRLATSEMLFESARKSSPQLRFNSDHKLGRMLRKFGCDRESDYRIAGRRAWRFPPLPEARMAWGQRMGTQLEWDTTKEWDHPGRLF